MEPLEFSACVTGNFWDECLFFEFYGHRYRQIKPSVVVLDKEYKNTLSDYILLAIKVLLCATVIWPVLCFFAKLISRKCSNEKMLKVPPCPKINVDTKYFGSLLSVVEINKLKDQSVTPEMLQTLGPTIDELSKNFVYFLTNLDFYFKHPESAYPCSRSGWKFQLSSPYVLSFSFLKKEPLIEDLPNDLLIDLLKAALLKEFPNNIWGVDKEKSDLYLKGIEQHPFGETHILVQNKEISMQTFGGTIILSKTGFRKSVKEICKEEIPTETFEDIINLPKKDFKTPIDRTVYESFF